MKRSRMGWASAVPNNKHSVAFPFDLNWRFMRCGHAARFILWVGSRTITFQVLPECGAGLEFRQDGLHGFPGGLRVVVGLEIGQAAGLRATCCHCWNRSLPRFLLGVGFRRSRLRRLQRQQAAAVHGQCPLRRGIRQDPAGTDAVSFSWQWIQEPKMDLKEASRRGWRSTGRFSKPSLSRTVAG